MLSILILTSCVLVTVSLLPLSTTSAQNTSILHGECIELFRATIRSPSTRDPYERRLIGFLRTINLVPDDFVAMAKKNSSFEEKMIISFISKQNSRAQR